MTTETSYFNPQGPHGPRRRPAWNPDTEQAFQSTRPSRASTEDGSLYNVGTSFQSTRPSRASTFGSNTYPLKQSFQSTRPSRASTAVARPGPDRDCISIHKALTGLDSHPHTIAHSGYHFNPQGPHGPRPNTRIPSFKILHISIHKALTGLDSIPSILMTISSI